MYTREEILEILKASIEEQLRKLDPEDVEVYEEYDDGTIAYRLVVSGIYTEEGDA